MLKVISLTLILQSSAVKCGLLGYGTGEGSCAAPPFRAYEVQWAYGCPHFAPCCSEFGFCRPLEEWDYGKFRDCNRVSNGTPLLPETIAAEEAAGPYEGKPAGEVGPPPDVIRAHHPEIKAPLGPPHPLAHHVPHPPPHHLPHLYPAPVHHSEPHPHPAPHQHPHPAPHPPVHHSAPHPHAPLPPPVHHGVHPPHPHPAPHPPVHHSAHPPHPIPHPPLHHGEHPHPVHHPPIHHVTHPHVHDAGHHPAPHSHAHPYHEPKQPAYASPEPHHPTYGVPEPPHPKYVAPEPHHPKYAAPEPHHPTYTAPEPHHPTYTAPEPYHPTYNAPEPHHPTYNAPEPHHPVYVAPEHHHPTYTAPEPHHPTYNAPEPLPEPHKPSYSAPEPQHSTYDVPKPPPYDAPGPHHPIHHAPALATPLFHVPEAKHISHHALPHHQQLHHPVPHHSPPHLVSHPPPHHFSHGPTPHHTLHHPHTQAAPPHHFSVHPAPAPITHLSPSIHPSIPVRPKPALLSHKPFVSFGSSDSAATKEPSLVNTVQLRKAAMDEKPSEKDKSSSTPSEETRKAKAFESENQFKTSTANKIPPSATPTPFTIELQTTTKINPTPESETRVSTDQDASSEAQTNLVSEQPPTMRIAPITIAALTNIFSTPAPIIFSTLSPSSATFKPASNEKEAFISFRQNNEITNNPADEKEDSPLMTLSISSPFTGTARPVAITTTRQPRILQAVTPLVNSFASTPSPTFLPSPTILPNPSISLGSDNPTIALTTLNNPLPVARPTDINLGSPQPIFVQSSPPPQIRIPVIPKQNAVLSIPVAKKSQDTSQCQHPRGGGSYTCISFGVPHDPIFAFHTVQGDDGFFFGTGSGFPEHKIVNGPATIRRRRKLQKVLIEKELARIRKEKITRAKNEMKELKTRAYTSSKTNDKLPITSYQKKLLEKSESEKIFQKQNKHKNRNTNTSTTDMKTTTKEHSDIYQTNFVSDHPKEMKNTRKSVMKTITTPKVQLYEYPVEETISYVTNTEERSVTTTPENLSDQGPKLLRGPPRRAFPSSYESLNKNLLAESYKP